MMIRTLNAPIKYYIAAESGDSKGSPFLFLYCWKKALRRAGNVSDMIDERISLISCDMKCRLCAVVSTGPSISPVRNK